jgi:hypothetical protein
MSTIAEMLGAASGITLTPESTKALGASRPSDMANAMLQYHCSTCTGDFDESTVAAVLKRGAAHTHGEAITSPDRIGHRCRRPVGPLATIHVGRPGYPSARRALRSAANRSASATTHRWVLADGIRGMIDASITDRPCRPMTRPDASTTAVGSPSLPIRHVPTG